MGKLELFVEDLLYYLSKDKCEDCSIIRKHSKKLEKLGDISFPINITNWYSILNKHNQEDSVTIFDYRNRDINLEDQCNQLKEASINWPLKIDRISVLSPNVSVFLNRSSLLIFEVLQEVLDTKVEYGTIICLNKKYDIKTCNIKEDSSDLTSLRLLLLKNTANNFVNRFSHNNDHTPKIKVNITLNQKCSVQENVLCGPILNENGSKTSVTAEALYK